MTFQRKRKSALDQVGVEQDPLSDQPEKNPKREESKRTTSENKHQKQNLSSVRILQRNTCYVIGISPNIAKEEVLRKFEYFGQYGKIINVTINKEKAY